MHTHNLLSVLEQYNPTYSQRKDILHAVSVGIPLNEAIMFVCYKKEQPVFDSYKLISEHATNKAAVACLSKQEIIGYVTWLINTERDVSGLTLAGKRIICAKDGTEASDDDSDQS